MRSLGPAPCGMIQTGSIAASPAASDFGAGPLAKALCASASTAASSRRLKPSTSLRAKPSSWPSKFLLVLFQPAMVAAYFTAMSGLSLPAASTSAIWSLNALEIAG